MIAIVVSLLSGLKWPLEVGLFKSVMCGLSVTLAALGIQASRLAVPRGALAKQPHGQKQKIPRASSRRVRSEIMAREWDLGAFHRLGVSSVGRFIGWAFHRCGGSGRDCLRASKIPLSLLPIPLVALGCMFLETISTRVTRYGSS